MIAVQRHGYLPQPRLAYLALAAADPRIRAAERMKCSLALLSKLYTGRGRGAATRGSARFWFRSEGRTI